MHSFTEENYLKTIYHLSSISESPVQTNAIAEGMNTRAASVTDMLKKLSEKSLIDYVKYQGVTLTDEGKLTAVKVIRKHRLWEVFLVDKLNFKWDEVHDIAEQLEHIDSELLIERLDEFLNFPRRDPHGDPIPDAEGVFESPNYCRLHEMATGAKGVIIGVGEHSSLFLKHLDKLGLTIGKTITVQEIVSYDGSVELLLGQKKINITRAVAQQLLINALKAHL